MFFILSKYLVYFVMPLTWILLMLITGLIVRNKKWKRRLYYTAGGALLFFSNNFIVDEVYRAWQIDAVREEKVLNYDLAVVLGGMSGWDNYNQRLQFYGSSDRLWQSIRLYKTGKVKKILISGGSGALDQDYREADFLYDYLKTIGLLSPDMLFENQSRNTHENALYSRRTMDKEGIRGKVLLISSGFHLRRARACFEKQGIDVDLYSTDRGTGRRRFDLLFILVPNPEALVKWNILLKEMVGLTVYRLKGYA